MISACAVGSLPLRIALPALAITFPRSMITAPTGTSPAAAASAASESARRIGSVSMLITLRAFWCVMLSMLSARHLFKRLTNPARSVEACTEQVVASLRGL